MAANEIVKNETVEWEDEDGGTMIAVNMALDIYDLSQAEPFVAEVAEAFLMQRMTSPPETAGLLITIVGKMQPDEFATFWSLATADNEPLQVFMAQMVVADAVGSMRDRDPDEMFGVSLLQQ
jgi:hypothetical protein